MPSRSPAALSIRASSRDELGPSPEDAVAAGANQGGGNEQDYSKDDLTLQQLDHANHSDRNR
jgi:hypothetical protein